MMMRPESRWTLDLGTGSGFLALLASRRSQHVLATDSNPRAVDMTRFNAILNDIGNVETAAGDLFEPTGDLEFDLIISNPPFVVSPENEHLFRDSGLKWSDSLTQADHPRGPSPPGGGGLRAGPLQLGPDRRPPMACFTTRTRLAERWEDGGNTCRRFNHPNDVGIQVGFAARDLLAGFKSDRDLLDLRLRPRSELRLHKKIRPTDSGWMVDDAKCILGEGLRFEGEVNQAVFHLLTFCRGQQPLSVVLQQVAARLVPHDGSVPGGGCQPHRPGFPLASRFGDDLN